VGLVGANGQDTGARFATLGDGMSVQPRGSATGGDGGNVEAESGGLWEEQRGERGEPSRQSAVLIFPVGPGGVVRGKGRLGEDIQPSKEAESLIEIAIAARAATLLVQ
jgi:hypothetical protein